jgi:NhaA family Na+:H+ antiporter
MAERPLDDDIAGLAPVEDGIDHVRGAAGAPAVLVEYGDFECPYCGQAYGVVRSLERNFGEDLAIVFREYPVPRVHPHALAAALAAEAAAAEGRFWEMHDQLFTHQDALTDDDLRGHASAVGVDPDAVVRPAAERYLERVRRDQASGDASRIPGTPSFFLNGRPLDRIDERSLTDEIRAVLTPDDSRRETGRAPTV